jgi:disulfide oxidoreductase YuzD
MLKQFLKENNVEFEYVDVDRCNEKEKEEIKREILSRGGELVYPTIIIDDKVLISGFRKDKLREVLAI